jgi:hypothetical protein
MEQSKSASPYVLSEAFRHLVQSPDEFESVIKERMGRLVSSIVSTRLPSLISMSSFIPDSQKSTSSSSHLCVPVSHLKAYRHT